MQPFFSTHCLVFTGLESALDKATQTNTKQSPSALQQNLVSPVSPRASGFFMGESLKLRSQPKLEQAHPDLD